ncbi:mannose-1-phosphate guanylyltransferase [bacterium]|nr:mannose-1-phosphate guanylyltransferase [bacterium]
MLHAVIMAGGVGARFWPLSRKDRPKQLIDLTGEGAMIEQTVRRLEGLVETDNIWVVTNVEQAEQIREVCPALRKDRFILEPVGRNTAPAIGLAAVHLMKHDPDAVMLVLPADHRIENRDEFHYCLNSAVEVVHDSEVLATIGIAPTRPETGYGYIQMDQTGIRLRDNVYPVKTFAEKPNLATAKLFFESGEFLWNSGMCVWRADTILKCIADFLPLWGAGFREIEMALGTPQAESVVKKVFSAQKGISIDYGVMEKAKHVAVVKGTFEWSDVGSWDEVWRLLPHDAHGNASRGNTAAHNTKNTLILGGDKLIAAVGVENLIVIETGDAILICPLDRSQEVKDMVDALKAQGKNEYL